MAKLYLDGSQAFALFRLPQQHNIQAVVQTQSPLAKKVNISALQEEKGLVFAPFFNDHQAYIINGGIYENITLEEIHLSIGNKEHKEGGIIDFDTYIKAFSAYLSAFNSSFSKAILSRPIIENISTETAPLDIFAALEKKHPEAFVYLLFTENFGLWLGATPEILLAETDNYFETVALAGTQKKAPNLVWGAKEKEEQQIVERYIEQGLNDQNIAFSKSEVTTTFSGEVAHLKTTFKIDKTAAFAQLVELLHPTPAVCGRPKEQALDLIKTHEHYDRALYTGFIGPCLEQKHLFVNLRCMQVYQNAAKIYVGGGITKDSKLEQEWEETELKSKTMRSVLEKYRTLHT